MSTTTHSSRRRSSSRSSSSIRNCALQNSFAEGDSSIDTHVKHPCTGEHETGDVAAPPTASSPLLRTSISTTPTGGQTTRAEKEPDATGSHVKGLFPRAGGPLPAEVLQGTFHWLRAMDLSSFSASSKAAASSAATSVLAAAVASLVKHRYGRANPDLREDDTAWRRDLDTLRHAELSHLSSLVKNGPPKRGKGYYLSKSWAGNLRRYVEAQARRRRSPSFASSGISTGKERRKSRGRERAESNLMPPWHEVNADIVCQHGGLAHSSQGTRGKRQVVDKRTWRELVAFFPCAMPFRAESSECLECLGDTVNERRAEEAVKKERGQEIAVPALKALFARKTGVPPSSISQPLPPAVAAAAGIPMPPICPLVPGIYHLLPRCWLNAWRAYVRDPRAPSPRTLDTGLLFCEGHGKLLAPPHVEEFLSGERRALLGGLDPDRSGCVCEVLTPQEWDALTLLYPCDFGVLFCIDPDNGSARFNSTKCKSCDPCYIGDLYVRPASRKLSV